MIKSNISSKWDKRDHVPWHNALKTDTPLLEGYSDQKKALTDRTLNLNNNMNEQPLEQIEKIFQFLNNNFKYFNILITFLKFIKDLIIDYAILFIINIIFLLVKNEE